MKTLKTIAGQLATLLAWLCVVGVLFLGAQNAHAQGYPVKPKFQDVRIGYNTFAECEAAFGAGACDLTAEQGVYSAVGFVTPGTISANEISVDTSIFADTITANNLTAQSQFNVTGALTASSGFFSLDPVANLNGGIDGVGNIKMQTSAISTPLQLWLQHNATSGTSASTASVRLDAGPGDAFVSFTSFAGGQWSIGNDAGTPSRFRICNAANSLASSCKMSFSDSLGITVDDLIAFNGSSFTVDPNGGTDEIFASDNFVFIQAETTIASLAGDISLSAGDVAQVQGTTSATLTSTNAANVTGGNVVITANASTIAANADTDFTVNAGEGVTIQAVTDIFAATSTGTISLEASASGDALVLNGNAALESDTNVRLLQDTASLDLSVASGAAFAGVSDLTVNGTSVCLEDGTNCQTAETKTFGLFSNGGSCTTTLGSNIASCTRSLQGVLSITFTTSYATAPACTANATANDQITVRTSSTTGGVTIRTFEDGAGLEDENVSLICMGNFP
jgi:hypothetical protein